MSRSRITPISAPISMNSPPWVIGTKPAFAESQAADQDERDRREPEAPREPREERDAEQERADLDEDERSVVHRISFR